MYWTWITYIAYLFASLFITVYVGATIYRHGEVFLTSIFKNKTDMVKSVNRLLLVGYYLVNIGLSFYLLTEQIQPTSLDACMELLSFKIASVLIVLAVMHYINIIALIYIEKFILRTT